jgi:hypothetical protein
VRSAQPEPGRAELLGTNAVSLGTYPNTEDRTARVRIRNGGQGELRLEHVISTCRCLRVDAFPRALGPGETGEVAVTVLKNEVSGAFKHVFFLETSDPEARAIKVWIDGYARPLFEVTCDAKTALGEVGLGQVWTGRYTVVATEAGYALGPPAAEERGTQSGYAVQTNRGERLAYEVTRQVTFTGEGVLESALLFPVLSESGKAFLPARLAVCAFRNRKLRIVPDTLRVGRAGATVTHRLLVFVADSAPPDVSRLSWELPLKEVTVKARAMNSGKGFYADLVFSRKSVAELERAGSAEVSFRYGDAAPVCVRIEPERSR